MTGPGLVAVATFLISLYSAALIPTEPGSGLAGSAHDFSTASWNRSGNACQPCHVLRPSFGDEAQESSDPGDHSQIEHNGVRPKWWNHATTSAVFATYVDIDGIPAGQPTGLSKLCLGCHDGSVALDDFKGGAHKGASIPSGSLVGGFRGVSGDLRKTHPISVTYEYDPADIDGLRDPSNPVGISGPIEGVLDQGRVSCVSCHDVHNQVAVAEPLLRAPMRGSSGLCLTCHRK